MPYTYRRPLPEQHGVQGLGLEGGDIGDYAVEYLRGCRRTLPEREAHGFGSCPHYFLDETASLYTNAQTDSHPVATAASLVIQDLRFSLNPKPYSKDSADLNPPL